MVRYARVGLPGPDVLVGQDAERLGPSSRMCLRVGYIGVTAYSAVYGRRKHRPNEWQYRSRDVNTDRSSPTASKWARRMSGEMTRSHERAETGT